MQWRNIGFSCTLLAPILCPFGLIKVLSSCRSIFLLYCSNFLVPLIGILVPPVIFFPSVIIQFPYQCHLATPQTVPPPLQCKVCRGLRYATRCTHSNRKLSRQYFSLTFSGMSSVEKFMISTIIYITSKCPQRFAGQVCG